MGSLYLGVDVGTSRLKATVLNEKREIVCTESENLRVLNPKPGFFEIEPLKTWWKPFLKVLKKLSVRIDLREIERICVSSICGTFVPVDERLEPIYNAILYGIDTRSTEQVKRLNEMFGEDWLVHRLGSRFTTHSIIPKLVWLKENLPEVYSSTRYFLESTNFITSRLTGEVAWDIPTASGCHLIDLKTMQYPIDLIEHIGLETGKLPRLMWPYQLLGEVSKQASKITGLKKGTKIVVGACDINMEAISCGALETGDLILAFGSTTSVLLTIDKLVFREGFSTGVSLLPNTYRLGGATSSGARFINSMKKLLRPLKEQLPDRIDSPTGLLILPYLDGARCPYHNPDFSCIIYGLRNHHNLKTLHIALIEALAIEASVIVNKLADLIPPWKTVHATGGLVKNHLLVFLLANCLGKAVNVHQDIDASCGCALLALLSEEKELIPTSSILHNGILSKLVQPDTTLASEYSSLVKEYDLLYKNLLSIVR